MTNFDFAPLFRSTVGFDRMMRLLETQAGEAPSYPPYNIEKTGDDAYRITMAVAGFAAADLEVVVRENTLTVVGRGTPDADGTKFLHRGIARRAFERRFELADSIKVVGSALDNGLLHIELKREIPESAKPRTIPIAAANQPQAYIDQKAA
ncbi:molecular chaperone IbpA [Stella humosa]|uniref:Molecular chaperone IbpA n=1 Tax=Stella humosa TaxID=94 RepID=A0A3N1LIB9_9PROT|nr:Hsp20 family protein [Stella humosa]ROP91277.1 molecular chaperone IbpA [Stella humosa]BBK34369.1 heat-shock protein Hsp20 [Stella humosa]